MSDVGSFYASTREVVVTDAVNAATAGNMGALITAGNSTSGAAMDIVNMGKISADKVVLEGENIRLLNSADITAPNGVTVRADEGYIHVGSANGTGGAGYVSENLTASGAVVPVEQFTLVDSTNWNTTLGTGAAVSGNYMLSEDIDASAISGFKNVASFTGKIDGNFYAVKNITNGTSGLFTSTNNATIVNMGVKDSTFSASGGDTGAFIQTAVDTTLINVYNDNSNITDASDYSAGLVGFANGITIKSSYSTGNVSYGNSAAGVGIVGYLNGGTNNEVTDSYSTGSTFNGLISGGSNAASITFDRTFSKGTAFSDNYKKATVKNSVVIGNGQYRVAGNTGIEGDKTGTIDLTKLTGITNLVANNGTTSDSQLWSTVKDITNTGGLQHSGTKLVRPTWRIYEGQSAPILTAFTQGIKTTSYNYEYFDSNNAIDTAAAKYNNGANNGQDMTPYTYGTTLDGLVYNGDTLKIVDSSGNAATSNATTKVINDAGTVFKKAANSTSTVDASHVFYNDAGQHDATYTPPTGTQTTGTQNKLAFIWSDQKGYDLVGNNISIAPRQVTLTNNLSGQTIVKEYDGSYDAAKYVPNLFNGSSTTSSGVLPVDSGSIKVGFDPNSNPTATFVNRGGTTPDANVGADKQVLINGKLLLTDGSGNAYTGHNYVIVNSSGNPASSVSLNTTVPAAIYQRQLKVSFNGTGITKTYDKDEFVKDSNGNLRSFSQSDFTLDTTNVVSGDSVSLVVAANNSPKYVDKTTGQVQVNVGTHDVEVGGVTLTGGTESKNYTLVDASGTPVYSELGIVTGVNQQGNPIGTGTGGGTFYTTGDITLRSLGDTGYKWFKTTTSGTPNYLTATKEYDGKSDYADPGTFYVSNAGSSSSSATTGMVAGDNLDFQVTAAEFTNDSTNVNSTAVRDANTTTTPQGVRYTVTVSGSAAGNYTFDSAAAIAAGTATALSNGGTAKVMGEGNITPRTIHVTTPQGKVADKTYDGDALVKDANGNTTFDLTSGYLTYANTNTYQQLVSGDGSKIDITGLYQAGNGYADKDVNYDATNAANPVLQKDIVYTAKIMQNGVVSPNYVFNISGSNQATFNGKGTINPVQLGAITFNSVSKTYDGSAAVTNTKNTTAPQYTDDQIKINTPTGIISGETISDVFHVDSNGNLDSTGAALLANGSFTANYGDLGSNGFTLNANVKRDPQNLSNILARDVEYVGISNLMKNHNYVLPSATAASDKVYGSGTINPFLVTDKSWIKLDRNSTPITKTYDGNDSIANPMNYLNTTGNNKANATVTTPAGKVLPGLASTVAGAKYSDKHSNNNAVQNVIYTVDFVESGNYGIDSSLKNAQGQVELTLVGDGVITQKHIIATTPKDPNVTKTYDATDTISKTGNALVDISSGILSVDQSRVTNGTTAKYVANASGAAADASTTSGDKTVEYTLALLGDTYQDYLLDDGNGNTTITGAGTINKRNLVISGNTNHHKAYDGTAKVTDMPTSLSGFTFGDAQDTTVLNRDNFDITKVSGLYGSGTTDASFGTQTNVGSWDVQYSGFFTALGSKAKNYTINGTSYSSTGSTGTAYGHGKIDPATFVGQFIFKLNGGITQTYSGSADVGQFESNTTSTAKDNFRRQWVDLTNSGVDIDNDGVIDITLGNGAYTYTINSATYTTGADAGINKPVKYTITLNPASLSNYTGAPSSVVLNDTITNGEIKAREVFVDLTTLAKNGLTKNYDATGAIYNNDNKAYSTDSAVGTVLAGSSIVTFDPVDTVNHTGLVKGTNASTGAYTNFDAGGSKVINYTADISGDSVSNYIFKDKNGNVLTNGQGAALTTNNNTINAFGVVLTPNAVNKTYDGTMAVTQSMAQGALQLGIAAGGQTVALQNINGNTGVYDNPNVNPDTNGNPGIHKVTYSGLSLGDSNYKLVNASGQELNLDSSNLYTIDGTGTIDPANYSGQFVFKLKNGINQIYSGSADVGQLENNTTAADKDTERRKWVDLTKSGADLNSDGVVDIALNNGDYTITQAVFTAGPDAGKNKQVDYTITLNPVALSNYKNIPASVVLNASITDGEIKAREVFVDLTTLAKNGLAKNYDATGAIYNNDNKAYSTDTATGNVLTGNSIIAFDTVNTTNHTGLVKGTNASTGAYTNFDAGSNKSIEYTVNISGDKLSNYIFKDANGNVLYDYYNANGPQQMTPLVTNNNTINAFGVVVTADQIAKPYDATDYVAPATAQNALHLGSAVGNDVVSLQNPAGINAHYVGVNVDDNGDGTPDVHAVNYTGLDLGVTGSALTNYQLVDSNGNALGTDTNGLHKFAGTGIINPYKLTAGDVTINIGDASKTYDATKDVLKNGSVTDLANNYITDHYVTIPNTAGGTQENLVFTSYSAEYNEANATANPVKPGNRVDYRLGLGNSNYDFSGLQAAGLVNNNNEWIASTGGNIDKAVVKASLANNPLDSTIVKTYDGKNNVIQDVTGKVSVAGLLTAKDGTVLNVNAINAQYKDKNVARDANGNVVDKDVYYHVELSGAAKDNYTIVGATGANYASLTDNTGTLAGTGRITPKELTIDFKPAERGYNGKANVNAADIQVEKFNGLQGNDSIALDSTAIGKITGTYGTGDSTADFKADGNVKRNGDAVGYKSVKYEHVADAFADYLARNLNTDAANYTVAKDTFYKESDNKGKINPVVLSDIKAKWQGVDKVYDATANVLNPENTMKLVTKDTALTGKEIELTYTGAASGVYVDSNGAAQKDVGNHALKYSVTEVKKNLGNYQLADSVASSAERDWLSTTAADNVDGQAVTGEITPLTLNVIAQDGFHKIYDGTEEIAGSEAQAKIGFGAAQAAVVQRDIAAGEISYDVDAHYVGSDANVAPGVIRNQKDIAYSLTLKGNTKGNYVLQGAVNDIFEGTAKLGDIEQRKVYVDALNVTGLDKAYDTTKDLPADYSSNGRFALRAADDATGVIQNDDVQLDFAAIKGAYLNGHVQRDADGKLVPQGIAFNNFKLTGTGNLGNYVMGTDSLSGNGTIRPATLTVSIKVAPTKVYDGEKALSTPYNTKDNLALWGVLGDDDVNLVVNSAGYQDANAATGKEYRYGISIDNLDYQLAQGENTPAITVSGNGQAGELTAYDGTIVPRTLTASVVKDMVKVYDGTNAGKQDAIKNIALSAGYLDKDKDSLGLVANAVYDGSDAAGNRKVTYTLSLGNTNYQLSDTVITGDGAIEKRKVCVVADGLVGIDKVYDGTSALPSGFTNMGHFRLAGYDAATETGIVAQDADIDLDIGAIAGSYASAHVKRDAAGRPIAQDIAFNNFLLANDNGNYIVEPTSIVGSGTITPRSLSVGIKEAPVKVYDGETALASTYAANDNLVLEGVLAGDNANLLIDSAAYADANAGKNKEYSYQISLGNGDYELVQGAGKPALAVTDNGQSGTITAQDGIITPRTLTASVIRNMTKEYDGTTDGVENAVANVSMGNVVNGDRIGLTATAVYDNPNAGKSEDTDELQEHQVTYTLSLANPNYQLETDILTGTGTISRKGLTIVATPASVNMGEPLPQFTGTVEGLVAADSGLASSFAFNTLLGVSTSNVTGAQTQYPVYGWYRNSYEGGNFGLNYTYSQAPANETAFTVNYINTDMGNPDLKPTPTHDVYQQVAKDVTSGFGDNNAAAIQYVDKNGKVLATETIGSGTIATGETMDGLTAQGTDLANIGIVGGDIVNLEGADAAGIANIEMQDKGAVVNLEVYSLNGEKTSTDGNPAAEIVSTDSRNALGSIQIVDESGHVLEEIDQDKAEKEEKEGEIAIRSSDGQNENEIELTVESTGVNVA